MKENSQIGAKQSSGFVTVNDTQLPYVIEGTGIPCIVIGGATYYRRVFSPKLRRYLRFIFLDTKMWTPSDRNVDFKNYTMSNIVDEVEQTRRALDLDRIAVLGHSYQALVALEYAKKFPNHTSHVIMIAMTPRFDAHYDKEVKRYWESQASEERKMILKQNKERLPDDSLRNLDPTRAFIARYVREGPMYWFDPAYDCSPLWEGVQLNTDLTNHIFEVILPEYDIMPNLELVTMPVFLALGRYDFVCPYYMWDDYRDKISNLFYILFEKSGHTPILEEQDLFDEELITWLEYS